LSRRRKAFLIFTLVLLLFVGMTLFYTRPLALKADDHTMRENSGDTLFHIYVLSWTAHSLKTNPFNLFNATIFYPNRYTLAYSDHDFMSSLIALPVMALTHNGILGFNFVILVSFIISALGAYLLVLYLTGDHLAGFAGGIIFGFPMYKLAHITHLQLVSTGFLPLSMLFLHLFTDRKKPVYALLFGASTVALFWTVWSYGFFLAFAILIYLAVLAFIERRQIVSILRRRVSPPERKRAYRWVGMLVGSFILIGAVLLPFVLPYLKASKLNPDFQRDISEIYSYSADVTDFLVAPPQSLVWGRATGVFRPDPYTRGNGAERSLFAGLIPYLLAALGIVYLHGRGRSKRFVLWFYVILAVLAGVMCLGVALYAFGRHAGVWMPYRLLYRFFPGFKAIRTPTRMFVLVLLSLSVLGGFGVKWIREKLARRLDFVAVVSLVVALLVLMTVEVMPTGIEMKRMETRNEFPSVYSWLAGRRGEAPTVFFPLAPYDPAAPSGMDDLAYVGMEPQRDYHNIANWKKMLNGYSGYTPVSYKDAVRYTRNFPSARALSFLRDLEIEYVVIEGPRYEKTAMRDLLQRALSSPGLALEYRDDGYYAFRLR
jgi:hypothetical protein